MQESLNRPDIIFHKSKKNINENQLKIKNSLRINKKKLTNKNIRARNNKKDFSLKKLKLKTSLNENDINNKYDSEANIKNQIISNSSKKTVNTFKSNSIAPEKKNMIKTPRINKSNFFFNNVIKNKKKNILLVNNKNNNIENKNENNNKKDSKKNLELKERIQKCKSSSIYGIKKRYDLYRNNFLAKKKELNTVKETFMKNNLDDKFNVSNNNFVQKTLNKNNKLFNYLTMNSFQKKEKESDTVLPNNKIKSYGDKADFKNPWNPKRNNKNIINKNYFLLSQKYSNNLFNNDSSSSYQEKLKYKKSSNLILDLPSIQNFNLKKSLNIKTERKKKSEIPSSEVFNKKKKNYKIQPIKRAKTINIFNNKINSINNIILNNKNEENENENRKENNESLKLSSNVKSNNSDASDNEEFRKEKLSPDTTETKIYNEDLTNKFSSDVESNTQKNSNGFQAKQNKNGNQRLINGSKLLKRSSYDESESNKNSNGFHLRQNKNDNQIIVNDDNQLIKRLSVHNTKNFFNQFQTPNKKRGKNFNQIEKQIREKILKSNIIKQEKEIKQNLKKNKKEFTLQLFKDLSKKILDDIEDEEKKYKSKENLEFNENFMTNEKNEYIKKVHKREIKLSKRQNKFNYIYKMKMIKIYKVNISHYSKINPNESKFFFFKYIFNNYFKYIRYIIFGKKDWHKEFKINNIFSIYNISNIRNSYNNSVPKKNKIYLHSIILQYLLMEKDKIQKYIFNEKYLDKTILQIKKLIKQAKEEMNDTKKVGNIKLNFILNEESEAPNNINQKKNSNDNLSTRNNIRRFTFLNLKKSEYSDTDKYDSKSEYDTQGIFPCKIKFNFKSKKDENNNSEKKEVKVNIFNNKKNMLTKRMTFNDQMFHSTYSNFLNTNTNNNINLNGLNPITNNNKKLENIQNIENKYNLATINREKIEKKYIHNITKNNDYFFKRRKTIKNRKKQQAITPIKEISFLKGNYMFKNMLDYRTDEIKTKIKKNIKSPVEMLFYQIKEHDFDEFCDLFERKQIDLNARNPDKDSFLIYAVKCKAMNFVQYLLKRGIDVNLENKYGNTALHYAFSDQNYELADVLLQNGADEFKVNIYGLTPWQCLGEKRI